MVSAAASLSNTPRFTSVATARAIPDNHRSHHPKPGTKQFTNPWPSFGERVPPVQFMLGALRGEIGSRVKIPVDVHEGVGWQKPNFASGNAASTKVAWLGHASCYLELARPPEATRGLRILCDPVFSNRCSPVQFAGPKRFTRPATTVDELPEIDLVLISHCHYDHLDVDTVTQLKKRFPYIRFATGLGNKAWFDACGIESIELDWWDEIVFEKLSQSVRLSFLPGQHFANRGLNDQQMTLWGSFSIEGQDGKRIWFAGDTGRRTIPAALEGASEAELAHLPICPAHAQIGQMRGPFDFAMIPIGAYLPRRLMSPVHISPIEAVEVYKEVQAKRAVAIHWGTFTLAGEEVYQAREELERFSREQGITGFESWNMGEIMEV
ncbi:beta-lactamase superfamily domain-domain-containing protein [Protomyces lactucae-debilis]|uniref:Beta-lactamase superfamily domain-domain-containing protein n=1 Tax=Protomyces lactucae-debilis TaxID=2754530 RepID=A0A1Y2EWD5_PROLT|nr:beta-lactamase superfamily domain-containing protein [Protomyces lactucae-debilis]ORY75135.1 beta-lactamase superfamily domain-domain-containing protein [Protomyces lactucae-debilis]